MGFANTRKPKNFLRQISCFATSRTAHQTESKSCDGKCVNCLHVLFKFGPKSRFFIRHDVLKSDPTVFRGSENNSQVKTKAKIWEIQIRKQVFEFFWNSHSCGVRLCVKPWLTAADFCLCSVCTVATFIRFRVITLTSWNNLRTTADAMRFHAYVCWFVP